MRMVFQVWRCAMTRLPRFAVGGAVAVVLTILTSPVFADWQVRAIRTLGKVRSVLFGDFDGDGLVDLVVSSTVDTNDGIVRSLSFFHHTATGFSHSPTQTWPLDRAAVVVQVADVVPSSPGPEVIFATSEGVRAYAFAAGAFDTTSRPVVASESSFTLPDPAVAPTFEVARDLSGDGIPEIVLADGREQQLRIFERDRDGTYRLGQTLVFSPISRWGHHFENEPILNRRSQLELKNELSFPRLFLRDFDGDGLADLAFGGEARLLVHRRTQAAPARFAGEPEVHEFGAIAPEEYQGFFRMPKITRIWVEDFDADGSADVYLTEGSLRNLLSMDAYFKVHVYYGRKGSFGVAPDQTLDVGGIAETAWSGDLNGDGHPDLVVQYLPISLASLVRFMFLGSVNVRYAVYPYDPATHRLATSPEPEKAVSFRFQKKTNSAIWPAFLLWNDFDGDRRPDLLQARGPESLAIFTSKDGEWARQEEDVAVANSFFVYGRDLNADGRDDVVLRYENVPGRESEVSVVLSRGGKVVIDR